jgi:hypothetical protein
VLVDERAGRAGLIELGHRDDHALSAGGRVSLADETFLG